MGSNQTKLDDYVYDSIAKYTELKREDILAWQERFIQHCDPGSTTMTKEQFCKFYQGLRPNENVKRLSENVFRAFDLNGDHGISFSEVYSKRKRTKLYFFFCLYLVSCCLCIYN